MTSILKQLYYGNFPDACGMPASQEEKDVRRIMDKLESQLRDRLDDEGKKLFEKYKDASGEASNLHDENLFCYSFQLAIHLMMEGVGGLPEG